MSEQLVKRLRELSNAVTRADWNEFSMRIPVEKDRDADFVLLQAADKIAALEADAARLREAMLDAVEKLNASEPALNGDGWTLAPIRNEMLSALGETNEG